VFSKQLHLTQSQLQKEIESAFPVERRESFLEVTFTNPRVLLGAGNTRIGLAVDMEAKVPGGRRLSGHMEADGGLTYVGDRGEITITDARLQSLEVEDLPKAYTGALRKAASAVAKRYFSAIPVYRLDQGDFQQSLAKLVLKTIEVRDGEVVVTIGL
jgi:hypothetical protein